MNRSLLVILVFTLLLPTFVFAQDGSNEAVATCSLNNGNEIAIRYQPVKASSEKPEFGSKIPYGTVWAPDNAPMVLFATGAFSPANRDIPAGAYTLFLIPNKNDW